MAVGGDDDMERDFAARLRLAPSPASSATSPTAAAGGGGIAFRAPQEQFTVGDFELGKIYGVGSYSKVVRAKKKDTGNVYALKIMDKKFITKENKISYVKMERIVLDQLDHPGVIRLFFTFQDTYSLYMALESCDGGELFDQIVRVGVMLLTMSTMWIDFIFYICFLCTGFCLQKGRLSEDEARFYAAEIVDILEYLHSLGLIHRDVKPENLLLTSDGHIKIADFGSVKPTKDTPIKVLPNSTNEKACTFVGTAAYVPPEVLNSAPPTFGNDLWALGCTLYQMLSGSSPFKDASEWLIFQRIIARDLKIPEYFSDDARDLIDKLLDVDPSKRPGAGPDGYVSLKKHPFFRGIDWKSIRNARAPKLAVEANANEDEDSQDSSWLSHMGSAPVNQHVSPVGNNGASSSSEVRSHISRLASIDSFDSRWQDFLEPGESVVLISKLKKINKLTNKKVQLILTDKPQLICVDPGKMVTKGNIMWSDDPSELNVQVSNSSHFRICTPKKVSSFEDAKQRAWQWKKAIEDLQRCQTN
uniref:non-specific serine/threonine protein kinase n=1 Tax=Oryza punctata TaxID=4537 RepID=A0A0E0JRN2_ORYPU